MRLIAATTVHAVDSGGKPIASVTTNVEHVCGDNPGLVAPEIDILLGRAGDSIANAVEQAIQGALHKAVPDA